MLDVFSGHALAFCDQHQMHEKLCLEVADESEIINVPRVTFRLFKSLNLNANYKARIEKDYSRYLELRKSTLHELKPNLNESMILKIKEMNEIFPSKRLDWLQMINNHLMSDSQASPNDKILIQDPKSFERLYNLFTQLEEK